MTSDELKGRTKGFALRVMLLLDSSRVATWASRTIANQLVRAATSVGANYRAACRARSGADFIAKMGIVEEELDESLYWMELLIEGGLLKKETLEPLMREANELLAITVASIKTARARRDRTTAPTPQSAFRTPQS